MKLGLLGSSFLLCFEAVSALYPANVGQVQHLDYENHQFIRRSSDQKVKSFNVNYSCFGTQCKKVAAAINKLTNILSKIIQVKNQINIKVGYSSYCEHLNECNIANMKILGYGGPLKYHIIKNKDGKEVSYPIALYKQLVDPSKNDDFKSTTTPDIQLYFNSDDKYWFEGDGDIKDGQPDFYLVAARTLIRGLGVDFSIGRNGNYEFSSDPKLKNDTKLSTYETIFTPRYDASKDNSGLTDLASTKFRIYILDTLMVTTTDGKSINSLLDPYVDFTFPNDKIPSNEIISYLKKTPLNEASQKLEKLLNTPDSLAIKLSNGTTLALETSIKDNVILNSLFFNESKYLNTKDALLTAKVTKSEARIPSEQKKDWPTYPYGPLLIETLELMGYTLKDSYKNGEITLESIEEGNSSSNVKANFGLLAAIVSLYLLF